ncbi:MAG: hypothetical protein ABI643_02205 [Candidatus Doudnabacteria bacterium]
MAKKFVVALIFAFLFFPLAAQAAEKEIKKGDTVSKIVLQLTGSPNYRKAGIKVITDKQVEISLSRFDHVQPKWVVVVEDQLAKTVLINKSAGKTLAKVCEEDSKVGNCVNKLARLNSISRRPNKPLISDVYALPTWLNAASAKPSNAVAPTAQTPVALKHASALPTAPAQPAALAPSTFSSLWLLIPILIIISALIFSPWNSNGGKMAASHSNPEEDRITLLRSIEAKLKNRGFVLDDPYQASRFLQFKMWLGTYRPGVPDDGTIANKLVEFGVIQFSITGKLLLDEIRKQ